MSEWDDRLTWSHTQGSVIASEILRGAEETDCVVVLASAQGVPTVGDLRGLWQKRAGSSGAPVLLYVTYEEPGQGDRVALMGLDVACEPVLDVDASVADRIAADALAATNPAVLYREVRERLDTLRVGNLSGVRNEGLFASHVLDQQPDASDWPDLCQRAAPCLAKRNKNLLTSLGFRVKDLADGLILTDASHGVHQSAAVILLDHETFDVPLARFKNTNVVTFGLALARRENLPWLIVVAGSRVRLYPADPDVGVGRKGQTQTFFELDLGVLPVDRAGYLSLVFSPQGLADGGTVHQLLKDSGRFATGLAERLRARIYEDVIPNLAIAIAHKRKALSAPAEQIQSELDEAYHQAMILLFRMLFVAYAEDRGLLPYGVSEEYTSNALKTLALRIQGKPDAPFDTKSTSMWSDLKQVWEVIDVGDTDWGVPAYNGGLFTADPVKNKSGAVTYDLNLPNSVMGPAIRGLLLDVTAEGTLGPVDFRSLSVREFGTIYEGLLESGLSVAESDLVIDKKGVYIPATRKQAPEVRRGDIYFHSRSGSRKATGSYFTKPFAVEHLLDNALEPALATHLVKVKALNDSGKGQSASNLLFSFRLADPAMGSAHFLVAAVDRIEAAFSAFLADNPLPEVVNELASLRKSAAEQLSLPVVDVGLDDSVLLRRLIAKRCVYGLDINEIAVELSRLAMWIHTFVPGLPLSFLNHGLVWGNSLTGVGSLDEIRAIFTEFGLLFGDPVEEFLQAASGTLTTMAGIVDKSVSDVAAAAATDERLRTDLEPLAALCDLIVGERTTAHLGTVTEEEVYYDKFGKQKVRKVRVPHPDRILLGPAVTSPDSLDALREAILTHPDLPRAREIAAKLHAVHMPVAFPEVFMRENPGFDCIVGNPPWDEVTVEVPKFWRRYYPGLMGMKQDKQKAKIKELKKQHPDALPAYEQEVARAEEMRKALLALPYPGLGTGDVDLYQIFAWRCWTLLRDDARLGMVFPRSVTNTAGTAPWREAVLDGGRLDSLVFCTNTGKWLFDEVDGRYTIAFVCLRRTPSAGEGPVGISGPFHSLAEFFDGKDHLGYLDAQSMRAWATGAAVPLLANPAAVEVFTTLRAAPRLDRRTPEWDYRPVREFDATNDRKHFDAGERKSGRFPVVGGRGFDIWDPETGAYYAWADPEIVEKALQAKRRNQVNTSSSAFYGVDAETVADPGTLPFHHPRIAFRDVTRATDSRTFRTALVPPNTILTNKAPYFLRRAGDTRTTAFLLGVLSSLPLDWYTRRYVEVSMNLHIVNGLPVPDPSNGPLAQRIVDITATLVGRDERFSQWVQESGAKPDKSFADADLMAELDAVVALAYGLTARHLRIIYGTFHRGWNYQPQLSVTLAHYQKWAGRLGLPYEPDLKPGDLPPTDPNAIPTEVEES